MAHDQKGRVQHFSGRLDAHHRRDGHRAIFRHAIHDTIFANDIGFQEQLLAPLLKPDDIGLLGSLR